MRRMFRGFPFQFFCFIEQTRFYLPRRCLLTRKIYSLPVRIKKFLLIQSFLSLISDPVVRHSMVKAENRSDEASEICTRKHQLAETQFETTPSSVTSKSKSRILNVNERELLRPGLRLKALEEELLWLAKAQRTECETTM